MNTTEARKAKRPRRPLKVVLAIVSVPLILAGLIVAATPFSQMARGLATMAIWGGPSIDHINYFPNNEIKTTPGATSLPEALDGSTLAAFKSVDLSPFGLRDLLINSEEDLGGFFSETGTTAFLVLKDGVVIHKWYAPGVDPNALHTSFSVSKSFLSALVGIAIGEGKIESLDDPITKYIPELMDTDPRFGSITLRHLITMESGLKYVDDMSPYGDAASTYFSTNLRATALNAVIAEDPGKSFLYNNYNPLLLGMVLERATGQTTADYMSEKLWGPMGAEADASWSTDSFYNGFEKMESGMNARPIDFAKFGLLFAQKGMMDGIQVVPQDWVEESTTLNDLTAAKMNYGSFWWVHPDNQFAAQGNLGQYIFVAPENGLVFVRLGREETLFWPHLLVGLSQQLASK
jgi:CubicO group peptidase (beta-lactamase class C family)